MTEVEIAQEVENDAREVRLTEQKIFQGVLKEKKKKSKRALSVAVAVAVILFLVWVLLHCIPLVLNR